MSGTDAGTDGSIWLKVNLAKTRCIQQVAWYRDSDSRVLTWTCSSTDCTKCDASVCQYHAPTVSSERTTADDLPPHTDCKYGDTVTIVRTATNGFSVVELAIIAKQGEI